jgi:phosphoribosyl-ATP pyrophosphohydrolase
MSSASPESGWDTGFLGRLAERIAERRREQPPGSYTVELLTAGVPRIAQKVGEEAVETVIAALGNDAKAVAAEAADLLYHLLVLLEARGVSVDEVVAVLHERYR